MLKKRRLSQNEEAIRGILLIIAFIVGLVFLRDILVKRGVRILMLTRQDYMNAAEYYMQKKYGEKFESEYIYDGSVYVHPKSNPYRHVVVDVETKDGVDVDSLRRELEDVVMQKKFYMRKLEYDKTRTKRH